jgi:hypothetical protein
MREPTMSATSAAGWQHRIEWTRSRAYHTNDQAWVEQKNGLKYLWDQDCAAEQTERKDEIVNASYQKNSCRAAKSARQLDRDDSIPTRSQLRLRPAR